MSKIQINQELINSIVKQNHTTYLKNINKNVNKVLSLSIESLSRKVSYINLKNVVLQPVNELLNNGFVDNSKCIYFLGIDNVQLELNTSKKTNLWKNFKERFKFAWSNRKLFKRRKRKRKHKKTEERMQELTQINFDPSKYTIYNLTEDMQNTICSFLSETSLVYLKNNRLEIFGRDDFGTNIQIVIYFVIKTGEKYKFFTANKRGFHEIDINERLNALNKKISAVGDNFTKMLKIFNTLCYNINGNMPNQVYIESLLCYIPDALYEGSDIYKVFLKIVNYLRIRSIRDIPSINNPQKNINNDIVCGNCALEINKLLNSVDKE